MCAGVPGASDLSAGHGLDLHTHLPGHHSLRKANQCVEAPHCTAGRIVPAHYSLTASLLEPKQEEKVCVHTIPEGGA